jgi:hypothetical protein
MLRHEGGPRPSEVLGEAILSTRGKEETIVGKAQIVLYPKHVLHVLVKII